MTSDEELRLECLRLAVTAQTGEPVREAGRLYDFVTGRNGSEGASLGVRSAGGARQNDRAFSDGQALAQVYQNPHRA